MRFRHMSKLLHAPLPRPVLVRQRGVTLIEALVALLVMSFGMIALVGLMSNLRFGADLAKQRSEAMRIARAEIATLRSFSVLKRPAGAASGVRDYVNDIVPIASTPVTPDDSNTTYTVQRQVTLVAADQAKLVRVTVSWTDRAGELQFVNLDTVIARIDPIFSAVVGFTPQSAPVIQPSGRSPVIPEAAKKLDKDISAFRPSGGKDIVWIFNNLTGVITGKCSIEVGTPVTALTTSDVESCKNNTVGYLLSGTVRFSNTNPANPTLPEAYAIHLGLDIVAGGYTAPRLDASGNPIKDSSGVIVMDSFTAAPPTKDCFNDSPGSAPSTQPFVNYYCIVYPDTGPPRTWSGKVILTDFSVGTTAAEYRVCRYTADYDGSGDALTPDKKSLDNFEHPAVYGNVTSSLARQNFLVIRGDVSCPTALPVSPSTGVFADYSTLQQQP